MKKTIKIILFITLAFLLSCCEGDTIYLPQPNKGLVNVYIEGDLSTAEAQAKLDAEVGSITENIYVQNTSQVTAVTIKPVANIRNINIDNNPFLQSVVLQGNGNTMQNFYIRNSKKVNNILIEGIVEAKQILVDLATIVNSSDPDALQSVNIVCHDLETITGWLDLYIGWNLNTAQHNLLFSDLKKINTLYFNENYSRWQGNFATFSMPKLEQLHNLTIQTKIDNLSFPKLKKVNGFFLGWGASDLGVINLPTLEEVHGELYCYTRNLNITFPSLQVCKKVTLYQDLTSSRVNEVLHQFLQIQPVSGKIINFYASSNPNASVNTNQPPTGQGLIDKQTLINQGNIVTTN